MNFSPFGSPFSASIPGIHQFAAGAQVSAFNPNDKCISIEFVVLIIKIKYKIRKF